ncbi:hypothetical protein CIPAW_07G178500 [Carya illinoinensis]|uniref:Uncharacterized protein n=1 Tax=Carya illinoinensis TaxID=32201 RepID=A0A8T1Q3Y9_CARIL|nr:hypothetical protein CIPAW_07G178500 [Carya illinoinensis]
MKPHALVVQKRTSEMPSSTATSRVKLLMQPSATMQVTGGTLDGEAVLSLFSLRIRSLKGAKLCVLVDSQRDAMSWVASSESGRLSRIVGNRKQGRSSRELGPRDFSRRLWLNSVLTKVKTSASKAWGLGGLELGKGRKLHG